MPRVRYDTVALNRRVAPATWLCCVKLPVLAYIRLVHLCLISVVRSDMFYSACSFY